MSLFLAVILLVLAATSTLAAFGGDTWLKGTEPLLKRVTSRGWVSLSCLVFALLLGVVKEIRSAWAAEEANAQAEQRHKDLSDTSAQILKKAKDLSENDAELRKKLGTVEYVVSMQLAALGRLAKSDPTIEAVQRDLKGVQREIHETKPKPGLDHEGETLTEVSVIGPTAPGEYTLEARVTPLGNTGDGLKGAVAFFLNGRELRPTVGLQGDRAQLFNVELEKGISRVAAQFIPDAPNLKFRGSRSKLTEYEVR